MLQLNNQAITETGYVNSLSGGSITSCVSYQPSSTVLENTNCVSYGYWGSYPVYVYTDKTKKAIELYRLLESEGLVKVTSVTKFMALIEKIAGTL